MRKLLLLQTALLLALVSCQKESLPNLEPEQEETAEVNFCISLDEPSTKSYTGEYSFEKNVERVTFFVFNEKGMLDTYFTGSPTSSVTKTISTGTKTIWALVNINPTRFYSCTRLSQFESCETNFHDMSRDAFSMSGKVTKTITSGSNSLSVPVERYVARIFVEEIVNNLEGNLEGEDIEIRNIYVTNVVGNCLINGSFPSSPIWFNKFGRSDWAEGPDDYINCVDDSELEYLTVSEEGYYLFWEDVYEACAPLYFFPNNATSDVNGWSSTFTKRYTRIVVEAYIRDELYFYPVNIIGAQRNHSYSLILNITRPGSKDPDTFVWSEIQDVSITIGGFDEWDDDFIITY